jgi:hypothetical protein
MRQIVKILAFLAAIMLITASAGVTVIHQYLSSTGETSYSSTQMTDDSIQSVEFYNQGSTQFSQTDTIDGGEVTGQVSGDFSGLTVYSDFTVVNNVGGEHNLSVSSESMSIDKNTRITSSSFSASEDAYLSSAGQDSYRSELNWWFDSTMYKERDITIPPLGFEMNQMTYNQGTGYYSTTIESSLPVNIGSNTYINAD